MRPLLLRVHFFYLFFLSLLLSGMVPPKGAGPVLGLGSRLSHNFPPDDMARKLLDAQQAKPKRRFSWTEIYVPVRRCHAVLKNKMGEFSIPVIQNHLFKNIWCNWTIWAGPKHHIIIYVQGFRGNQDCEENPDKIIFQGVASIAESTIAYACWNKKMHVYATQALAVNVALLSKNYARSHRYKHFRGKYFIFKDPRARASESRDPTFQVPFQRPSSKLTHSNTELKVELPVVTSQRSLEVTTPEPKSFKDFQLERSFMWKRKKVESSETSLPYFSQLKSESVADKTQDDDTMVTKTLSADEMSFGDELSSKALKKIVALDTRWLEIIEEESILSPGSTMDGPTFGVDILYENIPYLIDHGQSTIMEDQFMNNKSGRTDNQTDYLITISENVPINIKPTPLSHSVSMILSESEFLEKTKYSKSERIQISPFQMWSSPMGSDQQSFLKTEAQSHKALDLSTDSMENSLASETEFPLEGSLHLIPIVLRVHTVVDFSPTFFREDDLLANLHSGVSTSHEILETPGVDGTIRLSSQDVFGETGITLMETLVPELLSAISIRSTMVVRAEAELQTTKSLPGPEKSKHLDNNMTSKKVLSSFQENLTETDLMFVFDREGSFLFTSYLLSLSGAELNPPSPQRAMSIVTPEWVLQKIQVPISSVYYSEEVTNEQSLGIPLTLTSTATIKTKWTSVAPMETRTETDSVFIVQSINTYFDLANHEESIVASMVSHGIPLSHHTNFSMINMQSYFPNTASVTLSFLPTPTLSIKEEELTLSLSSLSWAYLGEMFSSMGRTEPLPLFPSRNMDFTISVTSPKRLSLENLFEPLEGEHFIEKRTQDISQPVPEGKSSLKGRDASVGSEIPLINKAYSKMAPQSTLQWTPRTAMSISWDPDEIQTEVTVQPSKDTMVNESKPWKASSVLELNQKLSELNFTSAPAMSLAPTVVLTSISMGTYLPIRRCHVVLKDTFGTFSLPENLDNSWPNVWCNWTIWAKSKKHIVIYIKGFEGPENCDRNQDKIIFQGVLSSVEKKIFHACGRQGTLIFATQALAVSVLFISVRSYSRYIPFFEGQYFVFTDPERKVPPKPAFGSSLSNSQRLRERNPSSMESNLELVTKPQAGNFPIMNTNSIGLENKNPIVTETLILKNREVVEGEGKDLEQKHPSDFLPLIPTKGPLIRNKNSPFILHRQDFSRPKEKIKNSTQKDFALTLGMTLNPNTSHRYKLEKKAIQDDLPIDSLMPSHWPSKTLSSTKPSGIFDRLFPSAQRLSWSTDKTEKLVWQGDLFITKPSNLYSHLTVQSTRKPQDFVNNCDHLDQSFNCVLVKGKNSLKIKLQVNESMSDPSKIPREKGLSMNLLLSDKQVVPESSAPGEVRGGGISPTMDEVSKEANMDPAQSITLENIRHLNKELLDLESTRKMTASNRFEWNSLFPGHLSEFFPSLNTPCALQSFLREVTEDLHSSTDASHLSAPILNFQAKEGQQNKAMVSSIPGQVWKTLTPDGVLTTGYSETRTTSPSFGNESVLEFQHHPGDVLFEVTVEVECQAKTSYNASEVKKVLVDLLKQKIGGNLGHFSPDADAFKLTRIKRQDTSNVTFIFWLHLRAREGTMSDYLMSQSRASVSSPLQPQLRSFIRDTVEALQLQLKSISVDDVNECETGLEQCGEKAECLNGIGTYICHCKEDYEDHSPMQTGILCIHVPHSGIRSSFSYLDLLISAAVFAIILFMLMIAFCVAGNQKNSREGFLPSGNSIPRVFVITTNANQT